MKPRVLQLLFCCLSLFLWCDSLLAHADTIIQIKGKKLIGLPAEYEPAELDLEKLRLTIGDHTTEFSPFIKRFFDPPHDLQLSASWYHERDILPPYMLFRILPKKKDFSYELLLNLETLEVIKLSVVLRESDSITRQLPIAITDSQKKQ